MCFNQIIILVSDILCLKFFYMWLGFWFLVDFLYYMCFFVLDGDMIFFLYLSEDDVVFGVVIYLESDKVDKEVVWLQGCGFEFEVQLEDMGWFWCEVVLCDLDGYKIKIYYVGKNWVDLFWWVKD